MTDFESTIIIFLSIISVLLFALVSSMPFKTDKDTKELLKQICKNTRDKTILGKPVNVTVAKSEITKYGSCPTCGRLISSNNEYCEKCGQALDWSDTE